MFFVSEEFSCVHFTLHLQRMRKLTLFVPGFFGPVSDTPSGITLDVPAIEKYFRFGTSKNIQTAGFTQTLFQLFGLPKQKNDYPVAAVTRLVDDDLYHCRRLHVLEWCSPRAIALI